MSETEIFGIITITSLVLGLTAGVVMYRADFCVTAMFRDVFLVQDGFLLRQLLVIIILSMLLYEAGRLSGIIQLHPFPLLGAPSLTTLLAGSLFGLGMVLAGGCVVGTLYKLGGGSILSLAAFGGMLAGSALYAEFHPVWSGLAQASRLTQATTLAEVLSINQFMLLSPFLLLGGYLLAQWLKQGKLHRAGHASGYMQPLHAAVWLACIGFISYLVVGMPLGITTAYAKLGATVESWFVPMHVASLGYFSALPLNYVPPFADTAIAGGAGPVPDAVAAIQYPLIIGIIAGAFLYAIKVGEFNLHHKLPVRHYISALAGGVIVGMAARMVPGCNIWHLWGGVPILANQSLLFLVGLFPGAWLGSKLLARYVI